MTRSEIERSIDHIDDLLDTIKKDGLAVRGILPWEYKAVKMAQDSLRAELEREKNPMTCEGCKWHPIKYDFLGCIISRCENCCRQTVLTDRYEPKGEKE